VSEKWQKSVPYYLNGSYEERGLSGDESVWWSLLSLSNSRPKMPTNLIRHTCPRRLDSLDKSGSRPSSSRLRMESNSNRRCIWKMYPHLKLHWNSYLGSISQILFSATFTCADPKSRKKQSIHQCLLLCFWDLCLQKMLIHNINWWNQPLRKIILYIFVLFKALFIRDILAHNIAIKRYCDKKIFLSHRFLLAKVSS